MPAATALIREAWDRFLLYLPLAFMAVLALGSYWMVRTAAPLSTPASPRAVKHEPDYFMDGFSVRTFDAGGRLRSEVNGAKVRHFPDTKWLEIDGIRIRSFDDKGRLTTATADRGLTNEDGSEVQLMGHALVVREADPAAVDGAYPRLQYRGEFLHAFLNTERVRSHLPVELQRGKDRFSADRLEYDNIEQQVLLAGRVHGTLVPAAQP